MVGLATSFVTFFLGQAVLGDHKASIGDAGVLRAVIGGGLYMTLIAMFSMGVAAMLRSPMLSLGILMPFFFLISNILGNVSATKKIGRFLPDQAGSKIMQVVTPIDDDTPYGPWGGLGIMALWVLAALPAGMCCSRSGTPEAPAGHRKPWALLRFERNRQRPDMPPNPYGGRVPRCPEPCDGCGA